LHEFTSALEAHKPCGVLIGTGGTADVIPELMQLLPPPHHDLVIYDDDPDRLVQRIVKILDEKNDDLRREFAHHDMHWFLRETSTSPPPHAG